MYSTVLIISANEKTAKGWFFMIDNSQKKSNEG